MAMKSWPRLIASASMLSLAIGATAILRAEAQTSRGIVTGTITRSEAGQTFGGVEVRIPQLGASAQTGPDGRYRLPNVPPGDYLVEFAYIGEVLESRQITVGAEGLNLNVQLAAAAVDRVVVTGTRGAAGNARAQERAQDNLTSIVSADDIGNFADQNIAESLQRLPGLTVNRSEGEGQKVAVRGLSGSFVTVTVDGARLGSRREIDVADDRSTALDVFSSDLLNGVEVSKTLTPDQDADAIAGAINLRSLSAFARGRDSASVRLEYGYQEKSEDVNPKISGDFTRLYDLSGGGTLGIAGGLSFQHRKSLVDDFRGDDGIRSTVNGVSDEILRIYNSAQLPYVPSVGFRDPGTCTSTVTAGIATCVLAADGIYTPRRIDLRSDPADRTRLAGNLNIEYRPDADTELFLRGSVSQFKDNDTRNRQRWELDDATDEEIIALTANSGIVSDVDVERRLRFTEQEDLIYTASTGFERAAGAWVFNGQLDYTLTDSSIPSIESRFRERDAIVSYTNLGKSSVDFESLPNPRQGADPLQKRNYEFRQIEVLDYFTEDEYAAAKFDAQRDFSFNGAPAFLKFGAKYWSRERSVDESREELLQGPGPVLTLADIPGTTPPRGATLNDILPVDLAAAKTFTQSVVRTGVQQTNPDLQAFNQARDYEVSEKIASVYAMAKFQLLPRLDFIGGFRVEQTDYSTEGFLSQRTNFDDDVSTSLRNQLLAAGVTRDAILASPLGARYALTGTTLNVLDERVVVAPATASNDYTNIFPNVNFRWEPIDEAVIRLSYTEALQRPIYDQATVNAEIRTEEDTEDTDVVGVTSIANALSRLTFSRAFGTNGDPLRNPDLDPLISRNYDLSVSWYPNSDTFLQAAVFYKDIQDAIIRFNGGASDLGRFGLTGISSRDSVQAFINSESAWVQGVELTYSQNYTFLPAPFDGLFAALNVTFADSEQNVANDAPRVIKFQDQADVIGNLSLGWENETFSVRLSGNYVGERVIGLNSGFLGLQFEGSDQLEQERVSVDLNARWDISPNVQLYFDGINLNDAEERRFFQGGGITGPVIAGVENYGATYQLGVRARF